ncbi:hypothetical protein AUEXF2481DRAFT_385560 [Aureobasidium subglaciale EXF-2481]|uniref:Uncharacterized protein n=1 Tax=Aureobasidium subglaciale (strain EXF-2481) TaxID=1043005 RepID=A0A074ZKE0_AURSE|nr:uncharacterized protein AUEXF2481DRAFT_385560 [Aureobasidium subglaciale EXF-2481]KEQ98941.1 hypothetical protein AUEXF2481DRAFT_385560 [Aureobasidium subglaciale EXF-2481]
MVATVCIYCKQSAQMERERKDRRLVDRGGGRVGGAHLETTGTASGCTVRMSQVVVIADSMLAWDKTVSRLLNTCAALGASNAWGSHACAVLGSGDTQCGASSGMLPRPGHIFDCPEHGQHHIAYVSTVPGQATSSIAWTKDRRAPTSMKLREKERSTSIVTMKEERACSPTVVLDNRSQGARENLMVNVVGRKPVNLGWWYPVADHHVTRCWLLIRPAAREKMCKAEPRSAEVCPCQSHWPRRWMRGKRS